MQTSNTPVARILQTAPPLPLQPVMWQKGWKHNLIPESAKCLHKLRLAAVSALLVSENANAQQLVATAQHLAVYAVALSSLCRTHVPADKHRRSHILVFTWCFPAECASSTYALGNVVIMRSSLVAFEYMCVSCASCIIWARAAMSHHMDKNDEGTHVCFQNSFETLTKLLQSIPSATDKTQSNSLYVINQSQWNRLQRQALPMQLQVAWLTYFKESVAQRYHMCRLLRRLQENQHDIALATLHSAEQITFNILLAAREIILHNQYLREKQKQYADVIYKEALDNLIWFRNQSLLADAEFALSQTLPSVTSILLAIVQRSLTKYSGHIDKAVAQDMLDRCAELADIVSDIPIHDTTETACMKWRSALPSHQFRLS